MTGKVFSLVAKRFFAFVRADGKDFFFHKDDFKGHWADLESDLSKGPIEVTFDIVENPKGPRAANVSRTDFPNQAV